MNGYDPPPDKKVSRRLSMAWSQPGQAVLAAVEALLVAGEQGGANRYDSRNEADDGDQPLESRSGSVRFAHAGAF